MSGQRALSDRLAGLAVMVLVAAALLWAGFQALRPAAGGATRPDARRMRANEIRALENLGEFARAQEGFRERDWDGDGRRTYALFPAHLWRAVDRSGRPVDVNLVPRSLAFAMGPSRAVGGYYFLSLAEREDSGALDPEREWAFAAVPEHYYSSGVLTFLVGPVGGGACRILAQDDGGVEPRAWPADPGPEAGSWREIRSAADLARLQQEIH